MAQTSKNTEFSPLDKSSLLCLKLFEQIVVKHFVLYLEVKTPINSMRILFWRLQSLMCSKPAAQTPAAANLFVPPEFAPKAAEKRSLTSELLDESHFERLPWFKEVQMLQLNRMLLLKDCINAKRKVQHAESRLAFWTEWEQGVINGWLHESNAFLYGL